LGVMLYELLSGTLVRREGDTESILEAVRGEELPPLASVAPEVPEALCTVVDRALAFDREGRWESARAMQAALADFLHRNDPVVDDEVLAAYVADHSGAALADAGEETSLVDATTRELDDDAATVGLRLERRSLVILRAILVRGPLAIRGVSDRLLGLCRDIIFKRGGQTCRMDQEGITVAFGLVDAHDVVDQALRVALALREAIGDAAPGVGIGVVLARLSLGVGAGAPPRVEIAEALDRQLERMARRVVDGPVILAGGLAAAAGAWRLEASMHFPEARRPELTDWADDLEVARPLAGPVHESELRVTHPPGSRARLYGRELELKTLRDSFAEAIRVRETRSALIVGQPGLGKRTIVERFVDGLPPGAFYVLRGRGQWRHRNASLGLILELLRRFLGVGPTTTAASLEELLRGYGVERSGALAQALASTLVDDGEAVDGAGERTDAAPLLRREQLWELLRGLVGALARRRPVLVILEDLHFVDEHSFALLRAWLEEPPRLPILGVATARPGLRAMQLGQVASIARVELRELDARSRREMIVRRFEEPAAADELATAILERTGGNPLFIEETLAYLQRRQVIGWSEGGRFLAVLRADPKLELLPGVDDALRSRIDALEADEREVLEAASVLGQSFRPGELQGLVDGRAVDRVLVRLRDHGLLEGEPDGEHGALRFVTVSLHEVCRRGLRPDTAAALHLRAAAIRRARTDFRPTRDDGPIAEHLVQAGRPEEAAIPALRAARFARDVAGNVEAHYFLGLALAGLPSADPRRFDALLDRELILRAWGRRRAQAADLRALVDLAGDDPERRAVAGLRLLRFYVECGRLHHAEQLVDRVERALVSVVDPTLVANASGEIAELRSDLLRARGQLAAAERVARAGLDRCPPGARGERQRIRLYACVGRAALGRLQHDEAAASFSEGLLRARALGHRQLEAELLNHLGETAALRTRYQEAIDYFQAAVQLDRDLGDRVATGNKLANLGITYTAIGLYGRADRYLRKALELHEAIGHEALIGEVLVNLATVAAARGRGGEAAALLERAVTLAQRRGDHRTELRARSRLVALQLEAQRARDPAGDAAVERVAEGLLEASAARGLRSPAVRVLHALAGLAAHRGDAGRAIARAREAVALVREGAAALDGVLSIGALGRLLVERGDIEEGRALQEEAADLIEARLADLKGPDLRRGYLELADVRAILGAVARLPAA
ncbi:MAG: AAA family ATPase, partial [Myxococcales bacterium]|nr:AAA family ATPase [Myxococcales bacterium]